MRAVQHLAELRRPDARLVPAALAAWLAAALLIGVPGAAAGTAAVLTGVAVLGAAAALAGRRAPVVAAIALAAVAAALIATAVAFTAPARQPDALTELGRRTGDAVVELTGSWVPGTIGVRAPATLLSFAAPGGAVAARTPVLLLADAPPGTGADGIGTRLRVRAALRPADSGGDIAYFARIRGDPVLLAGPPAGLAAAEATRERLAVAAARLPGDGAVLLPGLAIGDDSRVPADLVDAMRRSSLSHLTAVSGANCAVVVAAMLLLGRALGAPRLLRIGAGVAALAAFVILVTPQPSVVRAAVMATVVLIAMARGRPGGGLAALSVAVVLLLAADPWLAREYGFVLSVLATAGLLVLSAPITAVLERWLPRPVAAAVAVPLSAQAAVQPVLILLNPALSLASVPANLLAAPAAPAATMLGLLAALALPVVPPAGDALVALAWLPAAWIGAVARWFADLPGAALPWPDGPAGALILAVAAVAGAAALLRGRPRLAATLLASVIVAAAAAAGGASAGRSIGIPANWTLAACDIGQGDALVLRSDGAAALIDTGDDPAALRRCLDRLGIGRLALLVLTHFDRDHSGAVAAMTGRADAVLVGPRDTPGAERVVAMLREGGARIVPAAAGRQGRLGVLDWRVLWPPAVQGVQPGNDASIVLRVDAGPLSAVLLGDLGEEAQRALLRTRPEPADVVKVAHHGSADQSAELYEWLSARVGLISVGAGNDYGHPVPRTLALLRAVGTSVLRTDRQGMLVVAFDGDSLRTWVERPDAPSAAAVKVEGWRGQQRRRRRSRSPGTRSGPPRSFSCPDRRPCSPTAPDAGSATSSPPRIRASR